MSELPPEKIQEWRNQILGQQDSGLSIRQWCLKQNINKYQFYYWKKRLANTELTRSSFTELQNKDERGLFFECNGIRLYVDQIPDPSILKQCLKTLRELAC